MFWGSLLGNEVSLIYMYIYYNPLKFLTPSRQRLVYADCILCRGLRSFNKVMSLVCHESEFDGKTAVLDIWRMWDTFSLLKLPDLH